MHVSDVNDANAGVSQISRRGFAPHQRHTVDGEEDTACEELVFVSAAGMGENRLDLRHRMSGRIADHGSRWDGWPLNYLRVLICARNGDAQLA